MLSPKVVVDGVDTRFGQVIQEINQRVSNQLPPSPPRILLELASLLGVSASTEHQIVRALQATVESYTEMHYDLSTLLEDLREPISCLREIYHNQVQGNISRKPTSILMCQECDKRSSVLKCEQCQDHFCQECFDSLHATGNRRSHVSEEVEQLVCIACDKEVASCQCIQCGSFFCEPCFASVHGSRVELHKHRKRTVSGLVCQECEHSHAAIVCEDCVDLFCSACYMKLHKNGKRKTHAHVTIDASGQMYKQGLLVPAQEAQTLIDRARASGDPGPWLQCRSDTWEPYWYNLATGESSPNPPST